MINDIASTSFKGAGLRVILKYCSESAEKVIKAIVR